MNTSCSVSWNNISKGCNKFPFESFKPAAAVAVNLIWSLGTQEAHVAGTSSDILSISSHIPTVLWGHPLALNAHNHSRILWDLFWEIIHAHKWTPASTAIWRLASDPLLPVESRKGWCAVGSAIRGLLRGSLPAMWLDITIKLVGVTGASYLMQQGVKIWGKTMKMTEFQVGLLKPVPKPMDGKFRRMHTIFSWPYHNQDCTTDQHCH